MIERGGFHAVLRKEWRQTFRDGRMKAAALLLLVLAGVSTYLGYTHYLSEKQTAVLGNETGRQHWLDQEAKNPHGAAHYGMYVFKQPSAATLFDPGVLPYTGISVFIEAHHKNDAAFQPARERTSLARFGDLNPAFFLIWLVPLVVVLMHFGGIAAERESGMLPLIACSGVSPRTWLLGKWASAWLLPLGCLVVAMAPALILAGGSGAEYPLWLLSALGFMLYFGCVINITLLVSARGRSASSALLVLLGLWMLSTPAVPRLAANVAESLFPTPLETDLKRAAAEEKQRDMSERMAELKQETLARYGSESLADLPINYDALRMQTDEEVGDRINEAHYAKLYGNHERQIRIYRMFSALSPVIPIRFLSMGFARSDSRAHWHFNEQAEQYRRSFVKLLNDEMMNQSRTGDWAYRAAPETWAKIPAFDYQAQPVGRVIEDGLPDLAILAAWFAVTGLWLFWREPARLFGGR